MNRPKPKTLVISIAAFLLIITSFLLLLSKSIQNRYTDSSDFMLDTFVTQHVGGQNGQAAIDSVNKALRSFENDASLYRNSSQIAQVNAAAGKSYVPLKEDIYDLLKRAKALCEKTGGRFDLTIAPVVELWGITTDSPRVPTQAEIDAVLPLVSYQDLLLDDATQSAMLAKEGQAIDLGGIAKGTAVDIAFAKYKEAGITSGYISLGGNIGVIGPKADGKPFRIGLRDPLGGSNDIFGKLAMSGGVIATTGGYERFFEKDGVRYHHVLDPATGYPANSDLLSVSIIAPEGEIADFLSTYFFIAGEKAVKENLNREQFQIIAIDKDHNVILSDSLKGAFTLQANTNHYQLENEETHD